MDIQIAWWNVNGKLDLCLKASKWIYEQDMLFVSETHGKETEINQFQIAAQYKSVYGKRGGITVYIKNEWANEVTDVQTNECYVGITLKCAPKYTFIGVYIPPYDSVYYNETCFADTIAYIKSRQENGHTVYIGGDFNSRPGDLNKINPQLGTHYERNMDLPQNSHGILFGDLCRSTEMLPLNHLSQANRQLPGQFTFHRGNKKSQIDYVLTNAKGLKNVNNMDFINKDWHVSDHVPITVTLNLPLPDDLKTLYIRSCELNAVASAATSKIKTMKRISFNQDACAAYLNECRPEMEQALLLANEHTNTCEIVTQTIQDSIKSSIQKSRVKRIKPNLVNMENIMSDANNQYEKYISTINNNGTNEEIRMASEQYNTARNRVTPALIDEHHRMWGDQISGDSDRDIWARIDWNGKLNRLPPPNPPTTDELASHFEELYKTPDNETLADIAAIKTDMYIPELDDNIDIEEVKDAGKQMKKGGFDFPKAVIEPLFNTCGDIILGLMNLLFGVFHPITLGLSILCALPKKGNLSLPRNYRGIQMMPLLAVWYDRIIANRLTRWISISYEQTAFQKGKSTIHQILILRLIIMLCKKKKKTLYLAFFDIEKAFDKVSRVLLLKRLVQMGIGHCMLETLKRMYSTTHCVLQFMGEFSEQFQTFCGIKQGAHSSVLLFIVFMDGLVGYLKSKCEMEYILGDLHCLLHADDTVVLSNSRDDFVRKCNHLMDYFENNKLKLNLGKSAYMIIHGKKHEAKDPLHLKSGIIAYKPLYVYLGIPISDTGSIVNDLKEHIKLRRPSIIVKLCKFLEMNNTCPIPIKLKVLKACVNSSLLYGCETWGGTNINQVEIIHRRALKMILGVRTNTPTDVIMIESGTLPLRASISSQQKRFWTKVTQDSIDHNDAPLARLLNMARECRIPYVRHYDNLLDTDHNNPNDFARVEIEHIISNIRTIAEDNLSKQGQYKAVNPDLTSPKMYRTATLTESDRKILTRYRCGSHKLKIETGRWDKTPRAQRICPCQVECQTLEHVLYRCARTEHLTRPDSPIHQYSMTMNCAKQLRNIETIVY